MATGFFLAAFFWWQQDLFMCSWHDPHHLNRVVSQTPYTHEIPSRTTSRSRHSVVFFFVSSSFALSCGVFWLGCLCGAGLCAVLCLVPLIMCPYVVSGCFGCVLWVCVCAVCRAPRAVLPCDVLVSVSVLCLCLFRQKITIFFQKEETPQIAK